MKRRILLLSALAMLGMATLPTYSQNKIVVKIAGMKPDGEPETIGMHLFGKYLAELSNGKYEVQVFPNSQLGKEDAYIAATRKGIIQMCATGTQTGSLFPAMAMLETPMLYDNLDHAHRHLGGVQIGEGNLQQVLLCSHRSLSAPAGACAAGSVDLCTLAANPG